MVMRSSSPSARMRSRARSVCACDRSVFDVDRLGDPHLDQRREGGPADHLPDDVLIVDGEHGPSGGADPLAGPQPDCETGFIAKAPAGRESAGDGPCGPIDRLEGTGGQMG